jgi:hypothetical protein
VLKWLAHLTPIIFLVAGRASATTLIVDPRDEHAIKTISSAAGKARAGDTVLVHSGVYRERVELRNSGTPDSPIQIIADPPGSVIITGADEVKDFTRVTGEAPIYRTLWEHVFAIDVVNGKPIEHHPANEPLWGRAEQVIVDDQLLLPLEDPATLRKLAATTRPVSPPVAGVGLPFAGYFTIDRASRSLCIRLSDGSDPSQHRVEASVRPLVFGSDPFNNGGSLHDIHVRGFIFRDAANFPQRAGVWLPGHDNLIEECTIERMSGAGVSVDGTLRRCIVRSNGHIGGSARGNRFVNEHCSWEGNSWKPIDRDWEAGGAKVTDCDGGQFRECLFRRNGGPGLWLDIDARNIRIDRCRFIENEKSGLFVEISRNITITNCLAARNAIGAVGVVTDHDWSCAGIQIAESVNCRVERNTCILNKDGIALREQGPRRADGATAAGDFAFFNRDHVITRNLSAFNRGYQMALWYDTQKLDPLKQHLSIDHNFYFTNPGEDGMLLLAPWQKGSRRFGRVEQWSAATGFDTSAVEKH